MNTQEEIKRGRGRPRRILTPTEKENFEKLVNESKEDQIETNQFYPGSQIKGKEDDQTKRAKQLLKDGQADSISKYERNKKEERRKQLTEYLSKHMVPRSHVTLRPSKDGVQSYEFRKATNFMAEKEMSVEFVQAAEEFKSISRELYPEDRDQSNLESIRPN